MNQYDRLVLTQKDHLPKKAKKAIDHPVFVWIQPLTHQDFTNNGLRRVFSDSLASCVTDHKNTFAVPLKKIWDHEDPSLYNKIDNKLTVQGYLSYWNAVNKTVKYVDTLLLKKATMKAKNKEKRE